MADLTPIEEWAAARGIRRQRRNHEPLCVWTLDHDWGRSAQPALIMCYGCLLVELRSDATYASEPVNKLALAGLEYLVELTQAHLKGLP